MARQSRSGGGGFKGPGQGEKLWVHGLAQPQIEEVEDEDFSWRSVQTQVGNLPGDITETEMHKARRSRSRVEPRSPEEPRGAPRTL